jgi:hypothetical protein
LKTHLKDTTGTQPSTLLTEERGGSIRERERERERAEAIFTPQHYDEHNDNIIVIIILQSGRVVANQFGLDWVGKLQRNLRRRLSAGRPRPAGSHFGGGLNGRSSP